jgi:hypothetical protein
VEDLLDLLRSAEPENSPSCTFPGRIGYTLGVLITEAQAEQWGEDAIVEFWARSATIGWRSAWFETYNIDVDSWLRTVGIPHAQNRLKALALP